MATYTLDLVDGTQLTVEAPAGITRNELFRLANEQMESRVSPMVQNRRDALARQEEERRLAQEEFQRRMEAAAAIPEETGVFGDLRKGFGAGFIETGELAATGAATLLDEEAEVAARDKIQTIADAIKPEGGDKDDLSYKIGQTFGSIAGFAAPAALAVYAGAPALLGTGIAGLLGIGVGAGEASERARAAGATQEERNRATRFGALIGSTEALPLGRILRRLSNDLGDEVVETIGDRVKRAAKTGGEEAAQEAAANILQNLNERGYNAEQAILEGAGEAGALGGGAGATIQLLVDAFTKGRRPEVTPKEPEQQALPAPEGIAGLIPDQRASQARERIAQALDEKGDVELSDMQDIVAQTQIPLPELERVVSEEMEKRGAAMADRARGEMEQELDELTAPSDRPPSRMSTAVADALAGRSAAESDIARNEQAVQAAAREREAQRAEQQALAAGKRGDERAFDEAAARAAQPDLFAREVEQERRRLGPEELRRPDQFMDDLFLEEAETVQTEPPAATGDLVDLIRQDEAREASAAVRRGKAVAQEADLTTRTEAEAEERVAPRLKAATEAPFREAADRRKAIVDDVLAKSDRSSRINTENAVRNALSDAGIKRTQLTRNEKLAVKERVAQIKQSRPTYEPDTPKSRDQLELEQQVAPRGVNLLPEQEAQDGTRRLQDARTGEGVSDSTAGMGLGQRRGVRTDQSAEISKSSDAEGLGTSVRDADVSPMATGTEPSALDDYGYRQSLPSQEYAQKKQKAAEDRAKKKGAPPSAKKLVDGPQTGFIGTDPEKPLFLDTNFVANLKGVNDEVVGPSNAKYKNIKKSVEKEGFDPDQKGSTVFIDVNHKGEAFIAEGNNRAAVAKEFGIPSIKAEVRYYNGAEEVDSAVSPQNIIQNAKPRPAIKTKPKKQKDKPLEITEREAASLEAINEPSRRTLQFQGPDRPRIRQQIGGTRVPVDKATLIAKGKPTFVPDPQLAPLEGQQPKKPETEARPTLASTDARKAKTKETIEKERTAATKEEDKKFASRFDETQGEVVKRKDKELNDQPAEDFLSASDKQKFFSFLNKKPKKVKGDIVGAFHKYFGQMRNPANALEFAIYDYAHSTPDYRRNKNEPDPINDEYYGSGKNLPAMGKSAATKIILWATGKDSPLSKEAQKKILDRIAAERTAAQRQKDIEKGKIDAVTGVVKGAAPSGKFVLTADAALGMPVRGDVIAAIKEGDLKGALLNYGAMAPNRVAQDVARALATLVGNTKLVTSKDLKSEDGTPLAGEFDPATNTITLDETRGMNAHALIHEMLHATTSAELAKPNSLLRKRLNQIYNDTKPHIEGMYGANSLDEFVSEAQANPMFRAMLDSVSVKRQKVMERFVDAVINFLRSKLGMPPRKANSVLTEVDMLVRDALAPSLENRAAAKLRMAVDNPNSAETALNDSVADPIKVDKNYYDRARSFLNDNVIPRAAKRLYLSLQPANILGQVSRERIPQSIELPRIIDRMTEEIRERNFGVQPVLNKLNALKRDKRKDFDTLAYLIPNASYERTDPRADTFKAAHTMRKDEDPAEQQRIYKDLRKKYMSMGAEGKALYSTLTNLFEAGSSEVLSSVDASLELTSPDAATRKAAVKKLAELLNMERGTIKPFAPLTREGSYRLEYNTLDPKTGKPEYFVEYYKTERARQKAIKNLAEYNAEQLKKLEGKTDEVSKAQRRTLESSRPIEGLRGETLNFDKAPSGSFTKELMEVLVKTKADQRTKDAVVELILDNVPQRSFLQQYRSRKDIRGFLGDVTPTGMSQENFDLVDMVQTKAQDFNRQIVQLKYGAELQKFKSDLNTNYQDKNIDTTTLEMKTKLNQMASFAQSPRIHPISRAMNAGLYMWTMGANVSSAALTFFDVMGSAMPRLMGKYGDVKTNFYYGKAMAILAKAPKERTVVTYGPNGKEKGTVKTGPVGFSIGNYDFDGELPDGVPKYLKYFAEIATEYAKFNHTITQDQLDILDGAQNKVDRALNTLNRVSSFFFHHSERLGREATMGAHFLLEVDRVKRAKFKKDNPNAKEGPTSEALDSVQLTPDEYRKIAFEVIDEVDVTLGSTAAAGRPIAAQSGIGNVAFLFKRFAVSKYYMMSRMFNDAVKTAKTAEEKEQRIIAQHQFARFMIATGLMSGIAGMPMMGAIGMIYDAVIADDEDDFDARMRKFWGEGWYNGMLNDVLGVDISSRIAMNSLLYRPPIIEKDQWWLWTLAEQLGGPAIGVAQSIERGRKLWAEGEWWRGSEAAMPASVRNALRATRYYAEGGAKTRRGDAVTMDLTGGNLVSQALGFAPADYIYQLEYNRNETRKKQHVDNKRRKLLRKYNMAAVEGDIRGMLDVSAEINRFNVELARAVGFAPDKRTITPKTLERSRRAFDQRTAKMVGGIEYTPNMLDSLREYDKGLQLFDWFSDLSE